MKLKTLCLIGITGLILMSPLSHTTEWIAAEESPLTFDKGNLSDQDYFKHVFDQMFKSGTVEIKSNDPTMDPPINQTTFINLDTKVALSEIKFENEQTEIYTFDDGSSAELAKNSLERMKTFYNKDIPKEFDQLLKEVDDKYIVTPQPENKAQLQQMPDYYQSLVNTLTTFETKGSTYIGKSDPISLKDSDLFNLLSTNYGENSTIQHQITVDSKKQSLTIEQIILPVSKGAPSTSETETTSGSNEEYRLITTLTPSDKQLPTLDSLDTITYEEFQKLLIAKNLDFFQ